MRLHPPRSVWLICTASTLGPVLVIAGELLTAGNAPRCPLCLDADRIFPRLIPPSADWLVKCGPRGRSVRPRLAIAWSRIPPALPNTEVLCIEDDGGGHPVCPSGLTGFNRALADCSCAVVIFWVGGAGKQSAPRSSSLLPMSSPVRDHRRVEPLVGRNTAPTEAVPAHPAPQGPGPVTPRTRRPQSASATMAQGRLPSTCLPWPPTTDGRVRCPSDSALRSPTRTSPRPLARALKLLPVLTDRRSNRDQRIFPFRRIGF